MPVSVFRAVSAVWCMRQFGVWWMRWWAVVTDHVCMLVVIVMVWQVPVVVDIMVVVITVLVTIFVVIMLTVVCC